MNKLNFLELLNTKSIALLQFILFLIYFNISCNFIFPDKEIYLIPDTFAGEFRIIYGEKCGLPPKKENGAQVLEIPHNGILIIDSEGIADIANQEHFLIDKVGNKRKLNLIKDYETRRVNLPGIFFGGLGYIGGAMPDGNLSNESPTATHYAHFKVFNEEAMTMDERERFEFYQNFDSPTNALVLECRKRLNK